jgi:hypothetical protein
LIIADGICRRLGIGRDPATLYVPHQWGKSPLPASTERWIFLAMPHRSDNHGTGYRAGD